MSFEYGNKLKIKIFGASHSEEIGVLIDGIPEGFEIDKEDLQKFLDRRKPGKDKLSTGRKESDIPEFSYEGKTLKAVIKNTDRKSKDYDNLEFCPRPGHADYPAMVKFGNEYDYRGG